MSVDFVALAQAVVAGVDGARFCLIVSRDGLALGVFPATEERRTLTTWSRLTNVGDVERGFVALPDEVLVFCRRGQYAALAAATPSTRPGVLLDRLEQTLLGAEEARLRREPPRQPQPREVASVEGPRGLRSPLHREAVGEQPSPPLEEVAVAAWFQRLRGGKPASPAEIGPSAQPVAEGTKATPAPAASTSKNSDPASGEPEEGWVIDRVALSHEFKGILTSEQDENEGPA